MSQKIEIKICQECGLKYLLCPKTAQFESPANCEICEYGKMGFYGERERLNGYTMCDFNKNQE